jgi:hypothetical protein
VSEYNCQLRVLVVESNPIRRNSLLKKLQRRFPDVYAADGEGDALVRDARQQVDARRCHVAVIVPEADDPTDPLTDLNALMNLLAPAGIVICAIRPDDRLAFMAGRLAMEYVRYEDPPSELWAAVEARGRQNCQCHLQVQWPQEELAANVASKLKMDEGEVTAEHLYDLLGRMFPDAGRVTLRPLPALTTTTLIASAVRRSVVLWASEQHPMAETERIPKAIKIGPVDEIELEVRNYQRYVDGWLLQNRQARMENHARLWHLGAITYTFLGLTPNDMVPFRSFYLKRSAREILLVLRQLFLETCRNWYTKERNVVTGMRLFELYDTPLQLQTRLEERADTVNAHQSFPDVPFPLPNPALWALDVGRRADSQPVTTAITHGDLHCDNFFVDRSRQAWLIDFGQTGPGHALRDFVELEADIKLRLTPFHPSENPALVALERALLAPTTINGPILPPPELAGDQRLRKVFQVITGLRHLASQATGVVDATEYYQALLYETLFMGTLRRLHDSVRDRARLSAALVAERLKQPPEAAASPPAVPQFTADHLRGLAHHDAAQQLITHGHYVQSCLDALNAQGCVYNSDDSLPPVLVEQVRHLEREIDRTTRVLQTLKTTTGPLR